jgi:predicted flap endonuclease-1-like 5' DNA nuclease
MSSLWWLILGLLAGWLIELVIDYRYWRRQAQIAAARLDQREAALVARSQVLDSRQAELAEREEEVTNLQTALAAKDAELLAQAQRTDQRAEEVARLEQAMDKRRADLDRMGLTLNEREKDIAARGEVLKTGEADYALRQEKLESSEADVARRLAVVSNRESAMQNWEARILAREHEVGDKEADLVRKAATATQLQVSLEAMKALVSRQYKTPDGADDLQAIEGIGPEIADLLHSADIKTFERLSETSLGELTRILQGGGSRFGLADPLSWAEQASYLVQADFIGFEEFKAELIGGKRRDADLLQQAAADQAESAGTPEVAEPGIEPEALGPMTSAPADTGAAGMSSEGARDEVAEPARPFETPPGVAIEASTDPDVGSSAGVSVEPEDEANVSHPPR